MTTDTLRQITGVLRTPEGSAFPNKTLTWFRARRVVQAQGSSVVLDEPFFVVTDAAGAIDHDVMAGNYHVLVRLKDTDRYFRVSVPDQAGPFNIADLVDAPEVTPEIITQVQALLIEARAWAVNPEDVPVETGPDQFSALHHARKAEASATAAAAFNGPWLDNSAAINTDEALTYTLGQPGTVAEGDYVRTRAEGFSFRVAASAATDHHRTNANGVKLYVLPGADGRASVDAFGAVGDGLADDTAALNAAGSSGISSLVMGDGKNYLITDTASFATNQHVDFNTSRITFGGTRDRPAVIHGASGQRNAARLDNVWIISATLDWSNTAFTGLRMVNSHRGNVHVRKIEGFTIGWDCYSLGQGYQHTTHNIVSIIDCRYSTALTCDGSAGLNFVNENVFLGGDATTTSLTNALGNCYGVWFRSVNAGYVGHNSNKWFGPCFQPGNGAPGDERIPVWFDGCGGDNVFLDARYESGRGPAMRCDGPVGDGTTSDALVIGNIFTASNFAAAGGAPELRVQQNGSARLNFARQSTLPSQADDAVRWGDLTKLVKSNSATVATIMGGLHFTDGSATPVGFISHSTNIRVLRDAIFLNSTCAIGFFAECAAGDAFSFMVQAKAGFTGRFAIKAFDANFQHLTYDAGLGPDIVMSVAPGIGRYNYWSAGSFGGSYYATNDGQQANFRVSSRVRYIQCLAVPGSAPLRLQSLGLRRLTASQKPLVVFSGIDLSPTVHYANVLPSLGIMGVYTRGDIAVRDTAASGGVSYFQCVTGGRRAPAWLASTAYVAGDLVLNDTTRIYECTTGGTSAGSGGPTGTGSSIADGTVTWRYLAPAAVFANGPNLP